jgi:aminotransferase
MAGASCVILETSVQDGFKIDPERLKALITEKTKLLVLPYPNNPTGAIMTREELSGIAEVLRGTNVIVLSDEIYAELTYTARHFSIANIPDMWERTVIVSGFSKAYAMTGWRLGYIAAPSELLSAMLKLHQYAIMCAPTASQFAAIEALKNGDKDIEYMKAEYNRRRVFILEGLRNIGIDTFEPEGAFYIFPKIGDFGLGSEEFCERLLYEERCAIVPGTAFGDSGEGFARISYAYSVKHIAEALEKMESFIKKLKR